MKILVTVGTTPFDSLIKYLDANLPHSLDAYFQISYAKYKPRNFEYIEFVSNINELYDQSDIIVSHAGAGSIYQLLEREKFLILVPNMDRIDEHQSDIANFMHKNHYAIAINDYQEILKTIENYDSIQLQKFEKKDFFKASEIVNAFG
jgi:beta-1,4-N-acetylglucosaminyltransferase